MTSVDRLHQYGCFEAAAHISAFILTAHAAKLVRHRPEASALIGLSGLLATFGSVGYTTFLHGKKAAIASRSAVAAMLDFGLDVCCGMSEAERKQYLERRLDQICSELALTGATVASALAFVPAAVSVNVLFFSACAIVQTC